eukprot:jgi/Hompol1/6039/HPOL_004811-RA
MDVSGSDASNGGLKSRVLLLPKHARRDISLLADSHANSGSDSDADGNGDGDGGEPDRQSGQSKTQRQQKQQKRRRQTDGKDAGGTQGLSEPTDTNETSGTGAADDAVAGLFSESYVDLALKRNEHQRPLWVCSSGRIILEAFSPLAPQAQDFLVTIAEPVSRPARIHEYKLSAYSLYAAVSVGMTTDVILAVLDRFSKVGIPSRVADFIRECTLSYGKVKLVLKRNRYFIESSYPEILRILLRAPEIAEARVFSSEDDTLPNITATSAGAGAGAGAKQPSASASASAAADAAAQAQAPTTALASVLTTAAAGASASDNRNQKPGDQRDAEFGAVITLDHEDTDDLQPSKASIAVRSNLEDESDFTQSFEISATKVEEVKRKCTELDFPLMEEYDFRNDDINADLDIDLSPKTTIRDYQEKSLSKMFGGGASGGRARSGIIVLPTGAGKTLVGITAACTVKKSTLVLCTNALSVEQWANEFRRWSTLKDHQIAKFTADYKQKFAGNSGVVISTYTMISHTGKRAYDTQKMIEFVNGHEWGLMILDEVHVVPANIFRRVLTTVAAHTKLGLTATLVREDDKIEDLNFLIGPKLYEANWMDLASRGHIAKVEATEIWCPMTGDFYNEYINAKAGKRRLLCVMNPNKFMAAEYLIRWREQEGDKIIVFSDNVFALEHYAVKLGKPFIYGETSHEERSKVLDLFRKGDTRFRTIFLSKVGDTSLDLPEATCLIQISSQFGSRRQEAQRMGRILRAKRRNEAGFKSRFYTLVSRDTDEVIFSARRRTFLVDQGYEFKIIPDFRSMMPQDIQHTLHYATPGEQAKMLALVKAQADEVGNDEIVVAAADDLAGSWINQTASARRNANAAANAAANGADGFGSISSASKRNASGDIKNSKNSKKSHALFKSWKGK